MLRVQVQNALHMGWVDYCAALITAKRMQEDIDGRTLIVHNGDVSYAQCAQIVATAHLLLSHLIPWDVLTSVLLLGMEYNEDSNAIKAETRVWLQGLCVRLECVHGHDGAGDSEGPIHAHARCALLFTLWA